MNHFSDSDQIGAIQRDRARYRNNINGTLMPYPKWVDERTGCHYWEHPITGQPIDAFGDPMPDTERPGDPFSVDSDGHNYDEMREGYDHA